MGKFATTEEAPSTTGEGYATETASKEGRTESAPNSVDAFTLKTSQPRRRGRPPGSKNKIADAVVQSVAEAPANYHLWSQLLIGSANTVVITWLGTECTMEKREADMLEPPIARILARLTPAQANQVSVFIDPMVMLIALGMWGNRIIRIQRAKKETISASEFQRASGYVEPAPKEEAPQYQEPVVEDMPIRTKVAVNPNGVPVAITQQMGEV